MNFPEVELSDEQEFIYRKLARFKKFDAFQLEAIFPKSG